MKLKKILLGLTVAFSLALTACDKNNTNTVTKNRGTVDNTIPDVEIPEVFKKATSYSVIHQLENENGEYDTVAIENVSSDPGVDTQAKAKDYIGYENLAFNQKKVADDGSTEIIIKYKLIEYEVKLNKEAFGGTVSGGGKYNINTSHPTLEAKPKIGYEFKGWYKGDDLVSKNLIYTPIDSIDDLEYRGVFDVKDEFKCLDFVSDENSCTVLGLLDKTVKLLEIPEGVTSIAERAFYGSGLITVKLPSTLETIGSNAFYNSQRLISMEMKSIPEIGYDAIPYTLVEFINLTGASAEEVYYEFSYSSVNVITNADDTTVRVDDKGFVFAGINSNVYLVGYVGDETKIELPSHPLNIEGIPSYGIYNYAFENDEIESIVIPETISSIEYNAFGNCTNLVEVYNLSPNINLTEGSDNYSYGYLGQYAKKITNDKSQASIVHSNDNYDYIITGDDEKYATIIKYKKADKKNIIIDQIDNLSTIVGASLFTNNQKIESVTLGAGVVGIEKNAFYGCYNLKEINLGSCEGILDDAFYMCKSLYKIELPSTLEYIGDEAFYGCYIFEIINHSTLELENESSNNGYVSYNAISIIDSKDKSILNETTDGFVYATIENDKYLIKYVGDALEIEVSSDYKKIYPFAFAYSKATKLKIAKEVELSANMLYHMDNLEYLVIPASTSDYNFYLCDYFDDDKNNMPNKLKSVFINSEITTFNNYYFSYIYSITTIGLTNRIESFNSWLFDNLELKEIYFDGTIEEFYNINFNTNYKITSNPDLSIYELNEDGNVVVNGKKYSLFEEFRIPEGVTLVGGDLQIPKVVKRVIIPEGVTEIAAEAFSNCSNLKEIVLPSTLKTIGNSAFNECKQLISCVLPEGLETIGDSAFSNTALSSIEVPESVTSIGEYAFAYSKIMIAVIKSNISVIENGTYSNCKNLQIVNYKENITSIGNYAFDSCSLLAKLKITEDLEGIGNSAFYGSGIISMDLSNTKVTVINNYTFDNCKRLKTVILNDNTTSIGAGAFSDSAITAIDLSNTSIDTIAEYTFSGCSKLKDIKLPQVITNIGNSAFAGCESVESNEYGNGVYVGDEQNPYKFLIKAKNDEITSFEMHKDCEAQGDFLFRLCKNLKTVIVPKEVANIGKLLAGTTSVEELELPYAGDNKTNPNLAYIFGYTRSDDLKKQTKLKTVRITAATNINGYAFDGCKATTIELPEELETIGYYAFRNCAFKEISIPSTVTSIGNYAFQGCPLETVDLSDLVNLELGTYVFNNCFALTGDSVKLPANMTQIPDGTFYGCTGIIDFDFTGFTKIGVKAFFGTGLGSVTIPSTITSVGNNAFATCQSLVDATFEGTTTTIDYSAFYSCTNLTTVQLPSKINKISSSLFQGCTKLETINCPTTITEVGEQAFYKTAIKSFDFTNVAKIGKNAFELSKIESLSLSKKTTSMAAYVFQSCPNLTEVYIDCSELGSYAFYGCSNLVKATFGDNNTKIGQYAFTRCTNLADIVLSKNLKNICYCAFSGCSLLNSFVLYSYNSSNDYYFPNVESYAFQSTNMPIIYFKGTSYVYNAGINGNNAISASVKKDGNTILFNKDRVAIYSETEPTDTDYKYWHYDTDGNPVLWS